MNQLIPTGAVATRFPLSFKEGLFVQDQFRDTLEAHGYPTVGALLKEDMFHHIDLWATINGTRYGVDVKRMKRLSRRGEQQNKYTCLELHGAHPNNQGWLYGGRADLIAFEQEQSYLLVWRERLIDVVEFRVSLERVGNSSQAIYKTYSRRDNERITWIETSLLRNDWVLFMAINKPSLGGT